MKILHTSDWHLGRTLYGRKRSAEFTHMLDWLVKTIQLQGVDVLLVAGDIFDTTTPSNQAQTLYYRFLSQVAQTSCQHVVLIAGNHDSPSLLNAPREILHALNVHVVGTITPAVQDHILVLRNAQGAPMLIVCAVPYLRDRDIRSVESEEQIEDKSRKLVEGIRAQYAAVLDQAEQIRAAQKIPVPLVVMGHLFTAGGQTSEGDGVRELYVGSLAHVPVTLFPPLCDYVALGHLHLPQQVGPAIRYSGSPLPMGFGEANQKKSVVLVEWALQPSASVQTKPTSISLLPVPVFQELTRLQGDLDALARQIHDLGATHPGAWLEIVYDGTERRADLRERLEAYLGKSGMEILRIKSAYANQALHQADAEERLEDLDAHAVFIRCLDAHVVPDAQRPPLLQAYQEILTQLHEDDVQAE